MFQADVSPTSGNVFTINSPSWFHHQGIAAGSTLKLEYMMTFADQEPNVISVIFNGEELCTGDSSTTSPTSGPTTTTSLSSQLTTTASSSNQSTASTTTASPSTQSTDSTTSTSGTGGFCGSNTVTNSWANNLQGTLRFTVPSDISEFEIAFETDIALKNIRVSKKSIVQIEKETLFFSFIQLMFQPQLELNLL